MNRDITIYLSDIVQNMDLAEAFTDNLSYDDFCADKKTVYAVLRCVEIIGEASKKIPAELRKTHPAIPWKEMSGMRDKIIHFYLSLDLKKIWLVLKEDIPRIKPPFERHSRGIEEIHHHTERRDDMVMSYNELTLFNRQNSTFI